jgi:hypothetical protein
MEREKIFKVISDKFNVDKMSSTQGKKLLARYRHGWKDNIRMHLREIGWEGVDWMHLA